MGLTLDLVEALGNKRSQRYSMLVKDGVIVNLNIEPPQEMACSLGNVAVDQAKALQAGN